MNKAILISIQPKWCELIATSKKSVEVRKTRPTLDTPFKVYIYCTKKYDRKGDGYFQGKCYGKVFGEFVCDGIIPFSITYSDTDNRVAQSEFPYTCMTDKQIIDYLGNGKKGYGWHISDLVIYDKPKEPSDFKRPCQGICDKCKYISYDFEYNHTCEGYLSRPPQSWCYVEELHED